MTPAARLQSVIEILEEIHNTPRPADALLSAYFRNRRFIGSGDRNSIARRIYGILRGYHRLHWWLERVNAAPTPRMLAGAWQVLSGRNTAADVIDMYSGSKYAPEELSVDEEKALKRLNTHTLEHPEQPEHIRLECPEWAADQLKAALGDNFATEMEAMLSEATLDLRTNINKANRDEVVEGLNAEGLEAEATAISPWGVRLKERKPVAGLALFKDGAFEIQDEGSQLIALMAQPEGGMQVCDFCAGAGGKTLALAAMMNNRGRVIACDVLGGRLKRARQRFKRAGLDNIEIRELTSERDKWVKRNKNKFDLVLVDAPCSGTGTWRRNPDMRFRQLGPNLDELTHLQKNILDSASRLVKPGGRLVYATCSLLPAENADQVEGFLKTHEDFTALPVEDIFENPPCTGPYLQLSPAKHSTDGFFAAAMTRAQKAEG